MCVCSKVELWMLGAGCRLSATSKKNAVLVLNLPCRRHSRRRQSVCLHTHSHTNFMLCIFCLFIFSFRSKLCTKSYLLQRHSLSASCTSINARMRNGKQMKKKICNAQRKKAFHIVTKILVLLFLSSLLISLNRV